VFRFVEQEKASYPVEVTCRMLGVSPSGFYAWRRRPPSPRAVANAALTEKIRGIHQGSRGTYGAPRVQFELLEDHGISCSEKRVARLMRIAGLLGVHRRRSVRTTLADLAVAPHPDLVERNFKPTAADLLWVADITYIPTWAGFLYLAVVVDAYSRKVVGWRMGDNLRAELVVQALNMAIYNRKPKHGVVHHSDRGCQYTSIDFGRRCRAAGVVPSMGSVGDAYDNAMAESFFATLECELIDRSVWRNRNDARRAVFDYIEAFYNPRRRHSSLGYLSPVEFERRRLTRSSAA
jgi:putative transposase